MSRLKALEPGSVPPPLPLAWLSKTWAQGHLHSLVCPIWSEQAMLGYYMVTGNMISVDKEERSAWRVKKRGRWNWCEKQKTENHMQVCTILHGIIKTAYRPSTLQSCLTG